MLKYGAPLRELSSPTPLDDTTSRRPPSRADQQQSMGRLSVPKRVTKRATSYTSAKARASASRQLQELFPLHEEVPEAAHVPPSAAYPEDWRRQPTPAPMDAPLTWVYGRLAMTRLASNGQTSQQAQRLVERLLAEHGVKPVNDLTSRREVRAMLRSPRRFGVLIDIVATRRNILSGSPHDTAMSIYRMVDERYPILVKFVFVGITDNGTKRVARDVFGAAGSGIPFGAVDAEHLYVVHPKGDEGDAMRARGEDEQRHREAERIRRHCTPKYVPPPPPEWLKRVLERKAAAAAAAEAAKSASINRGRTATPGAASSASLGGGGEIGRAHV